MKKWNLNLKTNRKLRLGTTATLLTVIVIAAVMIFNVIVGILYDAFPLSLDLTKDSIYTLSETSHKVAKNLKKDVEILVFAAKSEFESSTDISLQQWYRFTQEYGKLSGGRVKTKYLDPIADPSVETTYRAYDIEYGDILFLCGDRHRKISYADLVETETDQYSGATYTNSLVEMKLASNINAISGDKVVTLTFLEGHEENQTVIAAMKNLYERNGYDVDTLNLTSNKEPLDTTKAMFIVAPQTDYTPEEIRDLQEWLKNNTENGESYGRQLFVLLDYNAKSDFENLYGFLATDYGIKVTNELIVETNTNRYIPDNLGLGAQAITEVQSSALTDDVDILGESVLMPYTLRLELTKTTDESEHLSNHPIITYGESALTISKDDLANGKADDKVKEGTDKDKTLTYPLVGMAYAKTIYQHSIGEEMFGGEGHVIVSGSYLFPIVSYPQYSTPNENLALFPIRETCSLGDTVVIPSTGIDEDSLSYTATQVYAIRIIFFSAPIILIVVCLVVFLRRRHL